MSSPNDLKIVLTWGSLLEGVRNRIKELNTTYFGLLVNGLRFKDIIEEKKCKNDFFNSVKSVVDQTNKEISLFNKILVATYGMKSELTPLEKIELPRIKKIIFLHKDHPVQSKDIKHYSDYALGSDDSASSLSRKNTSLQLSNVLIPVQVSITNFKKSVEKMRTLFDVSDREKKFLRKAILDEVWKAQCCYTIGLRDESVFMIGRTLEVLMKEYMIALRGKKRVVLNSKQISSMDFDGKLNYLHHTVKLFSPNQHAKMMAVKWDRNSFGHNFRGIDESRKDVDAIIQLGIVAIKLLESRLRAFRKKR